MVIILNLIFFPLANYNSKVNIRICNESSLINHNLKTSKVSSKIFINGTLDWIDFRNAGNCTGTGTYSNPYIIEDLIIDGGGSGSCIHIENSDVFFRIENCTIYNSGVDYYYIDAGVKLYNVSNGFIKKNTITNNNAGIIVSGTNNTIFQNTIINNVIGIFASRDCTILENDVINNVIGILGGQDLSISLNNVSFNDMYGIWIYWGFNNSIVDNYINNNNGTGILLLRAWYNEIIGNEINNNKEDGIHLKGSYEPLFGSRIHCSEINIAQNIVTNNSCGIRLNITQEIIVTNNSISNNQISGIDVNSSREIGIFFNQINENYYGIKMRTTMFDEIAYNTINYNYYGIKMTETVRFDIIENTINYNHYGIYLNSSDGIYIVENTLHYNWMCFFETDDCFGNEYIDNDCIETRDQGLDWLIPIILGSLTFLSAIGIIILLYSRFRSNQK